MQKMRILSNSAKFYTAQPLLPAYIFRPHWPLPQALIVWGCGLHTILAIENMPRITV